MYRCSLSFQARLANLVLFHLSRYSYNVRSNQRERSSEETEKISLDFWVIGTHLNTNSRYYLESLFNNTEVFNDIKIRFFFARLKIIEFNVKWPSVETITSFLSGNKFDTNIEKCNFIIDLNKKI